MSAPLAIFDIDGTLVDSRALISQTMARAFEGQGLNPPDYEATRKIVGLSLMEAVDRLAPRNFSHEKLLLLVEAYKAEFVASRHSGQDHEPLYDGSLDLLETLKSKGWKMGVATGKSRRGLDAIIKKYNFEHYFDVHFCADDGAGKPDPFMVEANLSALKIPATQAVMIGDTSFDMLMGRAAHVHCLGVSWGFHTREEIEQGGAHHIVETMSGLNEKLTEFGQTIMAA